MLACSRAQYQRGTRWASGKRPNTGIPHISTERNPPQHGSPPTPPGLFGGLEAARPKAPHLHTTTTPYAALCGPSVPMPPRFRPTERECQKDTSFRVQKTERMPLSRHPFFFKCRMTKKERLAGAGAYARGVGLKNPPFFYSSHCILYSSYVLFIVPVPVKPILRTLLCFFSVDLHSG